MGPFALFELPSMNGEEEEEEQAGRSTTTIYDVKQ